MLIGKDSIIILINSFKINGPLESLEMLSFLMSVVCANLCCIFLLVYR